MQLFEAIVDANHRAVAGDASAGLRPADYADSLPVIALTCIDPRLNAFFPNALALPGEQFIWLRNAGNIVTSTMSSTMRSLALACAVKGGREIAIIGHTDCLVCRTTTMTLLDEFKALGVERGDLPENLTEFFGLFGSERQNVIKATDLVRQSPLIGRKVPVHGFLIDIASGKLDWLVNGYQTLLTGVPVGKTTGGSSSMVELGRISNLDIGEMKFPGIKIGDAAAPQYQNQDKTNQIGTRETPPTGLPPVAASADSSDWWGKANDPVILPPKIESTPSSRPPKLPLPPPIRPKGTVIPPKRRE
jgi:carbonic anhydrase